MAITFTATRSIPKSTKVRVRIVTTDAVEAGVVGIPDGQLSWPASPGSRETRTFTRMASAPKC